MQGNDKTYSAGLSIQLDSRHFLFTYYHFFILRNREKIHGLEYPPGQRIIIKTLPASGKSESEVFPFDCKLC